MLTLLSLASLLLALDAPAAAAAPAPTVATIPAGTKIAVHVTSMLSSHDMRTDQKFTFFIDRISRSAAQSLPVSARTAPVL